MGGFLHNIKKASGKGLKSLGGGVSGGFKTAGGGFRDITGGVGAIGTGLGSGLSGLGTGVGTGVSNLGLGLGEAGAGLGEMFSNPLFVVVLLAGGVGALMFLSQRAGWLNQFFIILYV